MNVETKLLACFLVLFVLSACNRQGKTETHREDVCLNNKGFEFLQAYYDDSDDKCLDSARFFLEKALKSNDGNSVAFSNLITVLGLQEEYGEMIELYRERLNMIHKKAHLAKAETCFELAVLYGKTGDTVSKCEMMQNASDEFEKCFRQKPLSVDLVVSYVLFTAYKDGKEAASQELKKYRKVFPDEDFYSAVESELMESNLNDYFIP